MVASLKAHIHKHDDLPPLKEEFAAWYIIMTWVYDKLPTCGYFRFRGDTGCIFGDARVVLGNGSQVKIDSFGNKHLQSVNQTLRIAGQGGALTARANRFHIYPEEPVMEIITESGKKLVGTHNHPLWSRNGWTRLDELKIGDKLRVITSIPGNGDVNCSDSYAGLLGYLIGDGGVAKDGYSAALYIADTEIEILPILERFIQETLKIIPSRNIRKAHGKGRTVDLHIIEIYNKEKVALLPREKRVPEIIWRSPKKAAATFLSWLYTADGCVYQKGRGACAIVLTQSKVELLRDVQLLLLRFGIHGRIVGKDLYIRRTKSIIKFAETIGFHTEAKKTKLIELVQYVKERREKNKGCGERARQSWEKIVSIKPAGVATVYDLEVPEHHRFIANGFVSHNTGKSRSLDVIGRLCYKPMMLGGAITPAPIYRMIRRFRGTLILDEADFSDSSEKDEVITVLNCGMERNRPVIRCNKNDPNELEILPCFGPKVFATRRGFVDQALESRCITHVMEETDREDISPILGEAFYEREKRLRKQLLMWRLKNMKDIDTRGIEQIDLGQIQARLKQTCLSYALQFKDYPEVMAQFKAFIIEYNKDLIKEKYTSDDGQVLMAFLKKTQERGKGEVAASHIQALLSSEMNVEFTTQRIGKTMKDLGLDEKKDRRRVAEGNYLTLYDWNARKMRKLIRRYIPDPDDFIDLMEVDVKV